MKASSSHSFQQQSHSSGFTLIELLVVIAIIAISAVVVVLTLNPAQLLAQSRDANRVSDMATLTSALNLYTTDQAGAATFNMGNASDTYISVYDPAATSTNNCPSLGLPALNASSGQAWLCTSSSPYRTSAAGWIPVNLSQISAGSPIGALPVDPTNQTSTGLFYAYNTNGTQFEVTADLESQKYKTQYGNAPQTSLFPDVISGGAQTISALYNPSGLVGYWPLTEGSGSSTVDRSGNGNNGTWEGTPIGSNNTYYTSGKVGGYAGAFDGSTDYIYLGNPSILQVTSFTVSAWIERSAISSYTRLFANYNGNGNTGAFVMLAAGNANLGCNTVNSGGSVSAATSPTNSLSNLGTWYFVACTYNGTTLTLYINGVSQGSITAGVPSYLNNYPFYIGAAGSSTATENWWPGSINDLRLYGRALSPAELVALYNAGK